MKRSWSLLLLLGTADGFLFFTTTRCVSNSTNPEEMQYILSYFYHALEFIRFDSNVGEFVGYTEFGVKNAERLNKIPSLIDDYRHKKYTYCGYNVPINYDAILDKSVSPYAVLHAAPSGGSEKVLVCSVYGFFPKDISVTWTNHQQLVTTGVTTTTGPTANGDWYYQLHSSLAYSPRSGDQISCVIEHISLKEPMVLDYGGGLSDVDLKMVLIGAAGLALGLILSLTGFFCYKFNNQDQN